MDSADFYSLLENKFSIRNTSKVKITNIWETKFVFIVTEIQKKISDNRILTGVSLYFYQGNLFSILFFWWEFCLVLIVLLTRTILFFDFDTERFFCIAWIRIFFMDFNQVVLVIFFPHQQKNNIKLTIVPFPLKWCISNNVLISGFLYFLIMD